MNELKKDYDGRYWVDGNGNSWSVKGHSYKEAQAASESLEDCKNCFNCYNSQFLT